jgi:hypothetical protein
MPVPIREVEQLGTAPVPGPSPDRGLAHHFGGTRFGWVYHQTERKTLSVRALGDPSRLEEV